MDAMIEARPHLGERNIVMTIDAMFTQFPQLTTDRLLLRRIQSGDAEALFATFSDEQVMEFYGEMPHQSVKDSLALIW